MHSMDFKYEYPENSDQHMVVSVPKIKKKFDDKYSYYKTGLIYKIARFFAYLVAYTIGYILCKFKHRIRYVGRENLKKYKSQLSDGCITVCNHVFHLDYLCIMIGIRPHFQYYPAWNSKLLDKDRNLVNITGGIPVPDTLPGLKKFFEAFERHIDNKAWIHFYPEAAMWPFYQKIRPFKKGAFILAEKKDIPILPMAFRFHNPSKLASFFGAKEPFATLHIGEPIYVDKSIKNKSNRINKLLEDSQSKVEQLAGLQLPEEKSYNSKVG